MKASFTLRSAIDKLPIILGLITIVAWVMYPATVKADNSLQNSGEQALVFEVKILPAASVTVDTENQDQNLSNQTQVRLASLSYQELVSANMDQIVKDAYKEQLRSYLTAKGSPFAQCVDLLVELPNADKILSLANAESALGLRAPSGKYNYWGIGGAKLWKMGNNVCEGIQSMDNFLTEYPRRSAVKYKDMSIVDMCGLYKQPCPGKANHHWVKNNNVVLNQLKTLKAQAELVAEAKVKSGDTISVATTEAQLK